MKTIIRLTTMGFLTLILSFGNLYGQEQSSAPVNANGKWADGIFSVQQKEMLKQRSAKKQAFREAFKATISQSQKDIMGDPRVMPADRKKAFRASLTDEQVAMIKSQQADMKKMREEFRATLTPEQKADLKKLIMSRKMKSGHGFKNGSAEKLQYMG
jgi:hypothetical protein